VFVPMDRGNWQIKTSLSFGYLSLCIDETTFTELVTQIRYMVISYGMFGLIT
jgi:hypothetical protein